MSDTAKAVVIFEREMEFRTDDIVQMDGEYFYRSMNGGFGGAWDTKSPQASNLVTEIPRTEARRLALEWGFEASEVQEKLP